MYKSEASEAVELLKKWGKIKVRRLNRNTGELLEETIETAEEAIEWQNDPCVDVKVSLSWNSKTGEKKLVINQDSSVGTFRELSHVDEMKIAKKIVDRFLEIRKLSYVDGVRIYIKTPTIQEVLEDLWEREKVEKIVVEGDFFSQPVENIIYRFKDGSCIIIGMHLSNKPFKFCESVEQAFEINKEIYY